MIEVTINNKKVKFEQIITVLQACEQANVTVPRFCYHEKLSVAGSCRMCLVEIEKSPKPIASCAMPIANGMVIFTNTPLVKKAQEAVIELLLINHPLDCPICDQAGECDLQDITLNFGSDRSRFFEVKRGVEDKECGPIVKTIMTRCIHCTRCIRFLTELAGLDSFGSLGRGEVMEIGTYLNKYLKTELSGNLIDLCPVGALTSKPYAFLTRNWELKKYETIDFTDALGSNIVVYTRNNSSIKNYEQNVSFNVDNILRILPKQNENINETWISDKTRYAFDGLNTLRLQNIFINKTLNFSWKISLIKFSFAFKTLLNKRQNFIGNFGNILSLEEVFYFKQFLNQYGIRKFFFNNKINQWNNDLPLFYQFNSYINNIEKSDLILLIGLNPRKEASMLNLKIRKHFFNTNVLVSSIGPFINSTFPILHLGNSLKTLIQILEGKNTFCKVLRKSKNPLILVGFSSFSERIDSFSIQNSLNFLIKKTIIFLKNFNGLNIVHQNFSQVHACELGLDSTQIYNSYYFFKKSLKKNNFYDQNKNILKFINLNISDLNLLKNSNIFLTLNTHISTTNNNTDFIFPLNGFFEREGSFLNTEGVLQKAFKVKTSYKLSRNSEDFFKALVHLDSNEKTFISKSFTKKSLQLELPFLENNITRKKFSINYLNCYNNGLNLKISPIKNTITNFYMTDNISKNSKIMAECSLFLKDNTNFIKI